MFLGIEVTETTGLHLSQAKDIVNVSVKYSMAECSLAYRYISTSHPLTKSFGVFTPSVVIPKAS